MRWFALIVVVVAACHAETPSPIQAAYEAQQKMPAYDGVTRCAQVAAASTELGFPEARVEVEGHLDVEPVRRAIRAGEPQFKRCYEQLLARLPSESGHVTATFVIRGVDGVPLDVEIHGWNADMDACLCEAFAALRFPKLGKGTVKVSYPLIFGTGI
jgi:hypothetical protein